MNEKKLLSDIYPWALRRLNVISSCGYLKCTNLLYYLQRFPKDKNPGTGKPICCRWVQLVGRELQLTRKTQSVGPICVTFSGRKLEASTRRGQVRVGPSAMSLLQRDASQEHGNSFVTPTRPSSSVLMSQFQSDRSLLSIIMQQNDRIYHRLTQKTLRGSGITTLFLMDVQYVVVITV